jgi:putative membrane protein (TIGR04086 family)
MKKQSKWHAIVLNALLGAGISCVVLVILLSIFALIGINNGMSDTLCMIIAYGCAALSWAIGGFSAGLRNRRDGILIGTIHGLCLLIVLIIVSLMKQASDMKIFSTKFLIYLLGGPVISGIGSIIGVHFALKNR